MACFSHATVFSTFSSSSSTVLLGRTCTTSSLPNPPHNQSLLENLTYRSRPDMNIE